MKKSGSFNSVRILDFYKAANSARKVAQIFLLSGRQNVSQRIEGAYKMACGSAATLVY
jgi:hypothetical protein